MLLLPLLLSHCMNIAILLRFIIRVFWLLLLSGFWFSQLLDYCRTSAITSYCDMIFPLLAFTIAQQLLYLCICVHVFMFSCFIVHACMFLMILSMHISYMYVVIYGWMDGCMDVWIDVWMYGCIHGYTHHWKRWSEHDRCSPKAYSDSIEDITWDMATW